MNFTGPVRSTQNTKKQFNIHLLVTGLFIAVSYVLTLFPLALFAIAQTMAMFGRKCAVSLAVGVLFFLIIIAFLTGFAPIVLAAILAIIATPLFLLVSILRQKKTSIIWSTSVLLLPIIIFFSALIFAPRLDSEQYTNEVNKIEQLVVQAQSDTKNTQKNEVVYSKVIDQLDVVKKDITLQKFMNYNPSQRLLYFVYGDGFAVFLVILLSFFASLFFLDFAFEQIEKLYAIEKYVRSHSNYSFDSLFLILLKSLVSRASSSHLEDSSENSFKIIKHTRQVDGSNQKSPKLFFGLLRKQNPPMTISFKNYLFFFSGRQPGWGLRSYQMPLILCIASILTLSSILFYFGDVQNIIDSIGKPGLGPVILLIVSVLAMSALSFLVLQGIFTALKWIPFGLLIILSIIFLLVSPFILVDLGPFMFLGLFGIVGLLGYLK